MKNSKFIQTNIIKGVVISLERQKLKYCTLCQCDLSSPHQCKRCKRMVCEKCSQFKAYIYDGDKRSKDAHKICNFCKEDKDNIKKWIDTHKIAFNKDSLSEEWLSTYQTTPQACIENYEKAKKLASKKPQGKYIIDECCKEIQQLINYSLKDFLLEVANQVGQFQQQELVINIVDTLLRNYPEIGFSPDLAVIAYFFLCFSSEASAYVLLTILYGFILPGEIYPANISKYQFDNEISIILGTINEVAKPTQADVEMLKAFLIARIGKYVPTIGFNFFTFEIQIFLLNTLFQQQKNYYEFLKCYASTLANLLNEIRSNSVNYEQTELGILRDLQINQVALKYQASKKVKSDRYLQEQKHQQQINTQNLSFNELIADKEYADQVEYLKTLQKLRQLEEIVVQKDEIIANLQQYNNIQDKGKLLKQIQELQSNNDQYINYNKQLSEQLQQLQLNSTNQLQQLNTQVIQLQQDKDSNTLTIKQYEAQIQQFNIDNQQLKKDNGNLNNQLKTLTNNNKENEQLAQLQSNLSQISQVNEKLIEDNLKLENSITQLKKSIDDLNKEISNQQKTIEKKDLLIQTEQFKVQEKQTEITLKQEEINTKNTQIQELQFKIDDFKMTYNLTTPRNHTPNNNSNHNNPQLKELQLLQVEHERILQLLTNKEQQLEQLSQLDSKNIELQNQLQKQQDDYNYLKNLFNKTKDEIQEQNQIQDHNSRLLKEIEDLKEDKAKIQSLADFADEQRLQLEDQVDELSNDIYQMRKDNKNLQTQIAQLTDGNKEQQVLLEQKVMLQTKIEELEQTISKLQQIQQFNENQLKESEIKYKQLEEQIKLQQAIVIERELQLENEKNNNKELTNSNNEQKHKLNETLFEFNEIQNQIEQSKQKYEKRLLEQEVIHNEILNQTKDGYNQQIDELENHIQNIEQELVNVQEQYQQLEKQQKEQENQYQIINNEQLLRIEDQVKVINDLHNQINILQTQSEEQERVSQKEIEYLKQQLDNYRESRESTDTDYQNVLQQKIEEIAILSELNSEISKKTELLESEIEQERKKVEEINKQNQGLSDQFERQKIKVSELLVLVEQLPDYGKKRFMFSNNEVTYQKSPQKDTEDAKNLIETKMLQNQLLKGLFIESQEEAKELMKQIETFKCLLQDLQIN